MPWKERERLRVEMHRYAERCISVAGDLGRVLGELRDDWQKTIENLPMSLDSSSRADNFIVNVAYFNQCLAGIEEIKTWLTALIADDKNVTK